MTTIEKLTEGPVYATRVQFDSHWEEYLVTTYELTRYSKEYVGTYHTDDKADAILTARVTRASHTDFSRSISNAIYG